MQKTSEYKTVLISQLRYNPIINARGDTNTDVAQLAATIEKEGLLQPLLVRPAGKFFEPAEGGRRYFAIEHLVKSKRPGWNKDTKIQVMSRKMTDAEAIEASLATHITRLDLTPAEEAVAFAKLAEEGKKPEDIAATFAVSTRFVQQRLALGRLPATILKALKAGELDTKTAEAFTLTGDAKQQLQLFNALSKRKDLNPQSVRQQLVGKAIRADDPHARFVGEKAYVEAGGTVTADLFGEEKWFEDGKLLGRLFDEKVKATAKALEAEGWSFVKVARDHWHDYDTYAYGGGWTKLAPKGQQSPEAKKRVAEIDAEIGRLKKRMAEIDKIDPDGKNEALSDEHFRIDDEAIPALTEERNSIPTASFTNEQKAKSGVVIRVQPSRFEIMYGMVDPETARAAEKEKVKAAKKREKARAAKSTAAGAGAKSTGGKAIEAEEPDFSGALKADLAKEMGGALQHAIAGKPQAAHYLLIATLVLDALNARDLTWLNARVIAIKATAYTGDSVGYAYHEKELTGSRAAFDEALDQALKAFIPAKPQGREKRNASAEAEVSLAGVLTVLEQIEHQKLMELQALLVARALSIDMNFIGKADVATLVNRVDPDVGKYWKPDKEFFGRLKKPDLIEALEEAQAVNIPRTGTKAQLVELAAAELPAKGWLPKPLRSPCYAGPGSNAWADAEGAKVVDAVASQTPDAGPERRCWKCGCTDGNACVRETEHGPEVCHWVTDKLCSHCHEAAEAARAENAAELVHALHPKQEAAE